MAHKEKSEGHGHSDEEALSTNVEMYLETIYTLTEEGGSAKTTQIANEWNVSPASATEMVQKLARMELVDYQPYHGVRLNDKGLGHARSIIRKHRLLERFLVEVIGMDADDPDVHDHACEMEHTLPDQVERWVCTTLGHPKLGLHGKRIPPGPCCPSGDE